MVTEIFIRKGKADGERMISIRFPGEVDHREMLARGYCCDGNSFKRMTTLDRLHDEQVALQEMVDRLGWTLVFK